MRMNIMRMYCHKKSEAVLHIDTVLFKLINKDLFNMRV